MAFADALTRSIAPHDHAVDVQRIIGMVRFDREFRIGEAICRDRPDDFRVIDH
jgi:hypothetical protein